MKQAYVYIEKIDTTILLALVCIMTFLSACSTNNKSTKVHKSNISAKVDSLETILRKDPNNTRVLLLLGKLHYNLATKSGNKEEIKQATKYFKQISDEKEKLHAIALVYLGSLQTIKAKYEYAPWNKLDDVHKGCALMDKAVELQPHNVQIRIIRAFNNMQLPDFFNRLGYAIKDLAFLRNDTVFSHLNKNLKAKILYLSGVAMEKNGEQEKAEKMYRKLSKLKLPASNIYKQVADSVVNNLNSSE